MTAPADHEVRLARAYLMRVAEPSALAVHAVVDVAGVGTAAQRVRGTDVSVAGWRVE